MKFKELDIIKDGFYFNCNTKKHRGHYKESMKLGIYFPTTKIQATFFIKNSIILGLLNGDDVEFIESFMNTYGIYGDYRYTKSKSFYRLINNDDLYKALKIKFEIK